jgi:hypothetical protein
MCCDGLEIPDCAAGGQRPQMLMSALPLLEGRRRQQRGDQPACVALELGPFARGVAVAENQEVQLRRGIAAAVQRDERARIRGRRRRDELVSGIDGHRPRVAEDIAGSRFLTTMRTGASGAGNRSDSEKVRSIFSASPVVSHSP